MLNTPIHPSRPAQADDTDIEAIVESGPRGAIALGDYGGITVIVHVRPELR